MRKNIFLNALLSAIFLVLSPVADAQGLPQFLIDAARAEHIKSDELGFWARRVDGVGETLSHNASQMMQPASVIKTVTTLCALDLLTPNFSWKTGFYAQSFPGKSGVVEGLSIKGGGDPHLVVENLWVALTRLKALGVRRISGDIMADRSYFDIGYKDPGAFDGRSVRSYNVQPSALLVNFQSLSLEIYPDDKNNVARIVPVPNLDGIRIAKTIPLSHRACVAWQDEVKASISQNAILFSGRYPEKCGIKSWHLSLWNENTYLTALLKNMFKDMGIAWNGHVVSGSVRPDSVLLYEHQSEPLREVVAYINKFSNNPMARQLFLTLGKQLQGRGSLQEARKAISEWLTAHQLQDERLFIDNGSGLSRTTTISAESLGRILHYGANSPFGAEFISSLPIAGVDGTMRRRNLNSVSAHLKTGRIDGVRSVAGYVRDSGGKDWSVVLFVNSKNADRSIPVIDKMLNWVTQHN